MNELLDTERAYVEELLSVLEVRLVLQWEGPLSPPTTPGGFAWKLLLRNASLCPWKST